METLLYSDARKIAGQINSKCGHNALAVSASGYKEIPADERFDEYGSRGVPLNAPASIICLEKTKLNDPDPRCIFFTGGCPLRFTRDQLQT